MDAVEALKEIGFWLERELAKTYRVEAFRKAAAAIEHLTPGRAREAGPGRQPQADQGHRRPYVRHHRRSGRRRGAGLPRRPARTRRRRRSPRAARSCGPSCAATCTATPTGPTAARRSRRWRARRRGVGREYQVMTDHSPRLTIANGLSAERLAEQLDVIAEVDAEHDDLRLLSGIEVDILDNGELDQTDEMLGRLDVVVASVHSKLKMDRDLMTRRMVNAIANPHTNVLGHCTGPARRGLARRAGPVPLRRRDRVRRLREVRCRRRDQLAARAARPAEPTDPDGARLGLPVRDQHRRARARAARLPRLRRRAGGGQQGAGVAHRHDLAGRAPAGVVTRQTLISRGCRPARGIVARR